MRTSSQRILQDQPRQSELDGQALHVVRQQSQSFSPWLRQDQAAVYVGCKSVKGFYEWRKRHGIVVQDGRIAKADLDRAIKTKRKSAVDRRGTAQASLRNLRKVVG